MNESTLRPMSISQVLDRTFHLYRSNFVLFVGVSSILPLFTLVMQFGLAAMGFSIQNPALNKDPQKFAAVFFVWMFCFLLVYVIGYAIASGATVHAVSKTHLGQPVTIGESYKKVFSKVGTILLIVFAVFAMSVAAIIAGEVAVGLILALVIPGISHTGGGAGSIALGVIAGLIGLVLLAAGVVGGIYIYLRFSLSIPASIVEGLSTGRALKRGSYVAGGAVMRLFLIYLLATVLAFGLSMVFTMPALLISSLVIKKSLMLGQGIQYVAGFIGGCLAGPIAPIAVALIYYDQRVRKEAFDLQLMMQSIEQQAPPPPGPAMSPIG
jgi:hypothetical protein